MYSYEPQDMIIGDGGDEYWEYHRVQTATKKPIESLGSPQPQTTSSNLDLYRLPDSLLRGALY